MRRRTNPLLGKHFSHGEPVQRADIFGNDDLGRSSIDYAPRIKRNVDPSIGKLDRIGHAIDRHVLDKGEFDNSEIVFHFGPRICRPTNSRYGTLREPCHTKSNLHHVALTISFGNRSPRMVEAAQ